MHLFFSIQIITEEFIHALSWTLIHSLWQGMLLSVAAGAIVFFTKRNSPALRYNLLAVSLLLFIIAVSATFYFQIIKSQKEANLPQTFAVAQAILIDPVTTPANDGNRSSITAEAIDLINTYATSIVMVWLLIIALQCVRFTIGLYSVYQLKRTQVFNAGEYWNSRINELRRQLKINKPVRLLQSGLAKVPAVIGFFSPVILFPVGMFTSLQAHQVEAILIHELAHIRRHDFLVNLLQNVTEIIFFFNPAVLWVSSLIKAERENCCDDIAVMRSGGKRSYINALMAFGQLNLQPTSSLANAFAGKNNHLINRIKRIIYNNNKTLNNMEKKFLAAGIILTGVLMFSFSTNNAQQKVIEKRTIIQDSNTISADKKPVDPATIIDTVLARNADRKPGTNETISTIINGKNYKIVTQDNGLDELYVNGKKIPANKRGQYKSVTEKIILQSKIDREQSKKDMIQSQIDMQKSQRDQLESRQDMIQSQKDMEESKKDMEESRRDMEEYKREQEDSQKDMEEARRELEDAKRNMEQNAEQSKKEMEQSKADMEQSKKDIAQAQLEFEQAKKNRLLDMEQAKKEIEQSKKEIEEANKNLEQSEKARQQSEKTQEEVIADLIKEKIIKDKKDISSFKLSDEELIVNGTRQPAAVYKKFKDKYVKSKHWIMTYSYSEN